MKVEIEFVIDVFGHDRATVEQMYRDWSKGQLYRIEKPDDLCKCAMPITGTTRHYCYKCNKQIYENILLK
jgi:hypothetical protein